MYCSGRRHKRNHYPLDPSSPFRPINGQEGNRYPQHQIGLPVKPIPIKEAMGSRVGAAPRRSHWIDDDAGFGTAGRAKRSLFTPRHEPQKDRGRNRMREQRNKDDMQPRAKSLNTREAVGSLSHGSISRQRPKSLDRSTGERDASHGYRDRAVPNLSPTRVGQIKGRNGAFKEVNPKPKGPDRSFYDHQPHKYWTPYKKGDRQLRRERAKTIAVPRGIDFTQPYLPNLSESRRAKTTGDLSRISALEQSHSPHTLLKDTSLRGTLDGTLQNRRNEKITYSPAILRRKPNTNIRRERPKSMPNNVLGTSIFGLPDENNNLKRVKNYYDREDASLVRPDKEFDLFPKAQSEGAHVRNKMSPRPNKKRITGRGL